MPPLSRQPSRDRLELSRLDNSAFKNALMSADIDLPNLLVYLQGVVKFDSVERVLDARVLLTMEGAPTLTLTLEDSDRSILRSGVLNSKLDIQVEGIWWRLASVGKQMGSDSLDLLFELREVAVLRDYDAKKIVHRQQSTRAEFILNLIREPVEFDKIPVVIPDLSIIQPIEKSTQQAGFTTVVQDKGFGIPDNAGAAADTSPSALIGGGGFEGGGDKRRQLAAGQALTVKGQPASPEQIQNATTILTVGASMQETNRVLLVVSIMVAIQESTLINVDHGDVAGPDSRGLFQQRDSWGSLSDRMDPAGAARLFFQAAIKQYKQESNVPLWTLAQDIQGSAFPHAYAQWQDEAEAFVTAFGMPGGKGDANSSNLSQPTFNDGSDFIFYRGDPQDSGKTWKKEDSWKCIQRNADEVHWRAFFAPSVTTGAQGMIFYWISEDDLYKSRPVMVLTEYSDGVEGFGFDYDEGKKVGTIELQVRTGLWAAPPGSTVVVQDVGPVNGRWLMVSIERSLFDSLADVTLKKSMPVLPEPDQNTFNNPGGWASPAIGNFGGVGEGDRKTALFGGDKSLGPLDGTRAAVVRVAEAAYAEEQKNHYNYAHPSRSGGRPYPAGLFIPAAHGELAKNTGIDCSSFATLVYKEAGADDPNKANYDGNGNTGTLIANSFIVSTPIAGDLIFYGGNTAFPEHVGVYVGNDLVIEIGSEDGIKKIAWNYRGVTAIGSYLAR